MKRKSEIFFKNCGGKVVCKNFLQNQVDKFGGTVVLYGTIELTTVWKNWMSNLGDKFDMMFCLEQIGCKIC